jgi:hypothetical protein
MAKVGEGGLQIVEVIAGAGGVRVEGDEFRTLELFDLD